MKLKAHKKKLIAALIIALLFAFVATLPLALKPILEIAIRAHGFPRAEIGSVRLLPSGIYIDKILLDPNGFTEIDDVEIHGSWRKLAFSQSAERISIKNIDISGELDKNNRVTIAGWDGTFKKSTSSNTQFPFKSFFIEGITLDLDTEAGALRLQGKIGIDTDNKNAQIINATFFGSQQQLTTSLTFKGNITPQGTFSGKADIQDTSINIEPIGASRLSGWVEFKSDKVFSAIGQVTAGILKYKDFTFADSNLTFDTNQPSPVFLKTKMSGQSVSIDAEIMAKPEQKILISVLASNLGELAAIGGLENKILSSSGSVAIKASVKTNPSFIPENKIDIQSIKTKISGGSASLRPFTFYGDGRKNNFVLDVMGIKLSELLGETSSVAATGSMSGSIPIMIQGSEITITNGLLKSDQPGSFKYAPKEMPPALQGNDPRMATVRLALSDYHYDSLEIGFDGPVNGNLKTTLKAKGTSPAFENRAVNLNLNLEGALVSALRQALQPGALVDTLQKKLEDAQ